MRACQKLKKAHEKAAADRFIKEYNIGEGTQFVVRYQGEKPDFVLENPQTCEVIGLEVATAYYSEPDARGSWQLARGEITRYESEIIINPDDRLAEFAAKVIADHCGKSYQVVGRLILLVDIVNPPLLKEQDVGALVTQVSLLQRIPFDEVYLGVEFTYSRYRLWRLFPGVK